MDSLGSVCSSWALERGNTPGHPWSCVCPQSLEGGTDFCPDSWKGSWKARKMWCWNSLVVNWAFTGELIKVNDRWVIHQGKQQNQTSVTWEEQRQPGVCVTCTQEHCLSYNETQQRVFHGGKPWNTRVLQGVICSRRVSTACDRRQSKWRIPKMTSSLMKMP